MINSFVFTISFYWLFIILKLQSLNTLNYIIHNNKDRYYYLIINNTYCKIHHNNHVKTIELLGFDTNTSNIIKINDITSVYTMNDRLDCPIKYKEFNCYFIKEKTLYINKYLTNNLQIIDSVVNLGKYFNPSIIPLNKQFIMINRKEPFGYISNNNPFIFKELKFNNTNSLTKYDVDYRMIDIPNQLDRHNGYILLVYNYERYPSCCVHSAIKKIYYNLIDNKYTFSLSNHLRLDYDDSNPYEKNWVPFIYQEELLFIRHLNPLHILKLSNKPLYTTYFVYKSFTSQQVITVSKEICKSLPWKYGDLRGGTQVMYIENYGYLGFFHSSELVCNKHREYYMGAYIISDRPPFKLIKMSYHPIVTKDLIVDLDEGFHHWSIVFPMSFYALDDLGDIIDGHSITIKPNKVVVSVGINDTDGLLVQLDFDRLIDSLIDTIC